MPPLSGFSDNPFQTRSDLVHAARSLLAPLTPCRPKCKVPHAMGTHFDETAAQIEGFARPLWVIGSLIQGGEDSKSGLIDQVITGLEAGTDPQNPDYWGEIGPDDQRMVEAEAIAFTLLATPRRVLWESLSQSGKENLRKWLRGINGEEMQKANWLWCRVFVNLALFRVCGCGCKEETELKEQMQRDLAVLDEFYIGDGWSGDGKWRTEEEDKEEFELYKKTGKAHLLHKSRNADYYSGSFAIQFSQLLYLRFAGDLDPARSEKYQQQARDFGRGFCQFFDADGAVIPFGRSLTYRFACAGFFAALAFANVPNMPAPLASSGAVRGYLLRHMRWWARHSDSIFHADGVLNLGWTYPLMYLAEDYDSPQSVYWALKTFIVAGLPDSDPFWQDAEVAYPGPALDTSWRVLSAPRQIICNHTSGNHHFLLSFAQYVADPFNGAVANYSKFAYSSSFGFSIPCGSQGLGQLAPDNTLALSRDGMQTWATKYRCAEPEFKVAAIEGARSGVVPAATVTWWPWASRDVVVETTVIPPTTPWPDWHVRIHRITAVRGIGKLFTAEGGFAIHGRHKNSTLGLHRISLADLDDECDVGVSEGILEQEDDNTQSILILSEQGASGIATMRLQSSYHQTTVSALKPEPNTNVMRQRTLIPLVEHEVDSISQSGEIILITKVFAISREANGGWKKRGKSLKDRWLNQPSIPFGGIQPLGKAYLTVLES
ncbi:hypothetical protein BJX63DRAFT_381590 [Aspergillus granulosus]|uniref:DUF2264 domain protein n=1 Tax=Aspergillus granulosus TaxID=176169 RepID=A0ABR4HW78_9EURO